MRYMVAMNTGMVRTGLLATCIGAVIGCANVPESVDATRRATEGQLSVEQLRVVDCLLPGQVRRLGTSQYVTPRRPIRTTTNDCEIRGGEYVAYDRADYRSALNVWLERAEAGDPDAQNYVGEIFEKGLGREADYVSAAQWYRRAAEQGHSRAQINLGFLYEQGNGVERNMVEALNWYRTASGVSAESGDIVWDSAVADARVELEQQLGAVRAQMSALEEQIGRMEADRQRLQRDLARARAAAADTDAAAVKEMEAKLAGASSQIDVLQQLRARVETEQASLGSNLEEMPKMRAPRPAEEAPLLQIDLQPQIVRDINFGRYFALIIGNQDYVHLTPLDSPMRDAQRLKRVLEQRYGFSAALLVNSSESDILNALNDLFKVVGPQDNLLIYYAGHGDLRAGTSADRVRGYWLPVNAEPDRLVNWINNSVVSDHLDRIRARSVLVLADSCYAGSMASQQSALLLGAASSTLSPEAIKRGITRRARVVISSGGLAPVVDSLDGQHSLFAHSILEVLESNSEILRENMLFARVAVNVRRRASAAAIEQTPEMRPLRAAGHEGGDFYFVPRTLLASR